MGTDGNLGARDSTQLQVISFLGDVISMVACRVIRILQLEVEHGWLIPMLLSPNDHHVRQDMFRRIYRVLDTMFNTLLIEEATRRMNRLTWMNQPSTSAQAI